jgi:hypothetical protein
MKIEHLTIPTTPPTGDLIMRPVIGLHEGAPLLAGVDRDIVLDLGQVPPAPGLIALCRDKAGQVVILGYVNAAQLAAQVQVQTAGLVTAPDADGWLVIGTGKAQIRLHPDGRVRIKAEDITVESAGRLGLRGAWIDLN